MPRQRFVYRDGAWVDAATIEVKPSIHVQDDTMQPLEHPADGNVYDSRSKFREVTKAHNCVEMGNDRMPKIGETWRKRPIEDIQREVKENYDKSVRGELNISPQLREQIQRAEYEARKIKG